MFVCVSAGKDWYAKIIRGVTSLALRRQYLADVKTGRFKAFFAVIGSIFGIGKISSIRVRFNHSFFIYDSKDFGQFFALDILERGVAPRLLSKSLRRCKRVRIYSTRFDLLQGVQNRAGDMGAGYDWLGVLGALIAIGYFIVVGRVPRNVLHSSGRDFCSEYVASVINATPGLNYIGKPEKIYPELLAKTLDDDEQFEISTIEQLRSIGIDGVEGKLV